ncbi:GntR family transcriptional repressor for pyruvate dehydrogenase complex [Chitinivorax tropicus]|uniref:Pyruvate dehydrogenase complex repressor n=1 Tax=Chitinivorax tropicus TaxID=714531 RepID=A0A840MML9_9PROT|nr:FCD domain-containing protein [Chitinivorax tropicus]MBB5017972.1 GntR family transcriptional repressor for pyruvate dehydrogenase complex [Chitinivorax tropicus]
MFQEIKPRRVADEIVERLQRMILEGVLKENQRLPAERHLAEQFGVSRPSVREAIQKLVAKGLIRSRQGGGNYVSTGLGATWYDPLLALMQQDATVHFDLLEFRHTIETAMAYYAAERATEADRANISHAYEQLQTTYRSADHAQEAEADAGFHLAIAEASQNVVFLHTIRGLFGLLRHNVVTNLGGLYTRHTTRDTIMAQHAAIFQAIMDRDPVAARQASGTHVRYAEEALMELDVEKRRQARAEMRLKLMGD